MEGISHYHNWKKRKGFAGLVNDKSTYLISKNFVDLYGGSALLTYGGCILLAPLKTVVVLSVGTG
jgi:hypothetical protein